MHFKRKNAKTEKIDQRLCGIEDASFFFESEIEKSASFH